MEKKYYHSKTFWGTICSLVAFVVLVLGQYFGVELGKYVDMLAVILGAFGIPFTIYGRAKALGGLKK